MQLVSNCSDDLLVELAIVTVVAIVVVVVVVVVAAAAAVVAVVVAIVVAVVVLLFLLLLLSRKVTHIKEVSNLHRIGRHSKQVIQVKIRSTLVPCRSPIS